MANKTSKQGKNAKMNTEKGVTQVAPKSPIIGDKSVKAAEESLAESEKLTKKVDKSPKTIDKKDTKSADKKDAKSADKKDAKSADKKDAKTSERKSAKEAKAAEKKSAKSSKQAQKKPSIFKRIFAYFKNVRLEIKRTTWPTRNEVFRMSLIVVGALLFFGVFIFIMDWLMTRLVEYYSTFAVSSTPESGFPLLSKLYSSTFLSIK